MAHASLFLCCYCYCYERYRPRRLGRRGSRRAAARRSPQGVHPCCKAGSMRRTPSELQWSVAGAATVTAASGRRGRCNSGHRFTMKTCKQLLPPRLAVPSGQKKPAQNVLFVNRQRSFSVASTVGLACSGKHDRLSAAVHHNVQPWFSLFGMSLEDVYNEFPESIWGLLGHSPEILGEKDQEQNRNKWSSDMDFDGRFAESVVFDKMLYKYGISGCKTIAENIINEGISASDREEIVNALGRIENDIELGKFQWIDGSDVHTNIVEALANKLGDLPKDLAVNSKYDSCLMILETWCKDNIYQIMQQTKLLQVALVLLALRLGGLVLSANGEVEYNVAIENLVLPILKALDHDASVICHIAALIYSSSDDVIGLRNMNMNRCPQFDVYSIPFTIAGFAYSINYSIPDHLVQLLEKLLPMKHLISSTPFDEATPYYTTLSKFSPDEQKRKRGILLYQNV